MSVQLRAAWGAQVRCIAICVAASAGAPAALAQHPQECAKNDKPCLEQQQQRQLQQQQHQQQMQQQAAQRAAQQAAEHQRQQQAREQQQAQQAQQAAQQNAQREQQQRREQQAAQQQQQQQQARMREQQQMQAQQQQREQQQRQMQQQAQQQAQQRAAQQQHQQQQQLEQQRQERQQHAQPRPPQAMPVQPAQPQHAQRPAQPPSPPQPQHTQRTAQPPAPPQLQASPRPVQQPPAPPHPPPQMQAQHPQARPAAPPAPMAPVHPGAPMVAQPAPGAHMPQPVQPQSGLRSVHPPAPPVQAAQPMHPPRPPVAVSSPPAPTGRSFAVNPNTSVMPLANRGGFTMDHQRPDGTHVVINQRTLPTGASMVSAYRQTQDARAGTVTRTYANGQRLVEARDWRSRGYVGGPTYVNYGNGLRAASLASGQPLYRESYFNDRGERLVRRLVYASWFAGRPIRYREPLVRVYEPYPVWGYTTYVYRPAVYQPAVYVAMYSPFAQPIAVGPDCVLCPQGFVAYDQPVAAYQDPMDLLGDMQIAGAVGESVYTVPPQEEAQMQEFRGELSDLSQQLDSGAGANPELRSELAAQRVQPKALQQQLAPAAGAQQVSEQLPMKVGEPIRAQVRKQVRLEVARHQNGKPLLLGDIVSSGYASIWLFQAGEPLTVRNVNTGEDCMLNPGDLTSFAQIPAANSPLAQMNVVTDRPGSCPAKTIVEVPPDVLQEMLNGFSQRVESNMQRVAECSNPSARCTRL